MSIFHPICEASEVPEAIRQRAARLFVEVVEARERMSAVLREYSNLEAALDLLGDGVDDRALHLGQQIGLVLIQDLLLDLGHELGAGSDVQPVETAVAHRPRDVWPATAWPLPA